VDTATKKEIITAKPPTTGDDHRFTSLNDKKPLKLDYQLTRLSKTELRVTLAANRRN